MKVSNCELDLLDLIWKNEPVRSGRLVGLAAEKLGWKKSTVYTVVKHLVDKNIIKNENSVISSLYRHDDILNERSETLINRGFGGSLPMFLTAFLSKEKISKTEAEELKRLIDEYTEEN